MDDTTWIRTVVNKADTPEKILRIIVERDELMGFDPYYAELRKAMLDQAERVLASSAQEKRLCVCGSPNTIGVQHRTDGPRFLTHDVEGK